MSGESAARIRAVLVQKDVNAVRADLQMMRNKVKNIFARCLDRGHKAPSDCLCHTARPSMRLRQECSAARAGASFERRGMQAQVQTEPPRVYRRVKLSKDEPYDTEKTHPEVYSRVP